MKSGTTRYGAVKPDQGRVRVVTTCSQRKAIAPGPRARELSASHIARRAEEWINKLCSADGETLSASEMYQGDHWSIVCSLDADVWVCSAGYGLIPIDARIHAYGATFSTGHPDSVARPDDLIMTPMEAGDRWWVELAAWEGPATGAPRSIADLAAQDPEVPLLVVVSAVYLRALRRDLIRSRDRFSRPDQLMIVSIGADEEPDLGYHLLPGEARFQSWLGGSMQSLNARLAKAILESEWEVSAPALRSRLTRRLGQLAPLPSHDRIPRTDEEVRSFILGELKAGNGRGHTRLLRTFRDAGFACEQSRFRRLYHEVKSDQLDLLERERVAT